MATYIPGIETYVPQVQAFTPDYKFLENVMSKRQDRYTNNYNQLNELYGKVVYADVSREDNQNIRDQYAKELTPKLEQVSGLDLSLQENVNTAQALFKPFYEDKALVRDLMFTKEFRNQSKYMESLLNSPDEKIRKKYWDYGAKWMNYQMEDFKKAERDATLTIGNPEYVENVDLVTRGIDALKEYGMNVERTTPQGDWLITRKNGQELTRQLVGMREVMGEDGKPKKDKKGKTIMEPVYTNPAYDFLEQTLLEDPAVAKAYFTKARVDMREFATANTDKYGSYEEAQKYWANETLTKFRGQQEEKLIETETQLKGMDASVNSWEEYKTKNGIVPGTAEEEAMLKRIFERDILKESFEKRQDNLKDKSAPVNTTDLLLNKAFGAQMAFEMGTDMTKAAIAYSMIDYKETMKANPFKVDYYKHQYNMAAINQRHMNKMREIEFKALVDPSGGTGGNGVDLGFGADGSGVEVVTNMQGTEVNSENFFDRNSQSITEAQNSIDAFELDHLEYAYSSSPQLESAMQGEGPIGTVSYKRAKYDTDGNFTGEYEDVNKSWYDAKQDLMKYENKGERERLANLTESIMVGTLPADGEGNADLPNDWALIEDPGKQKEFFMQRQQLELMKKQFANAYAETNGTLAEAYSLVNSQKHSSKGGMRNAKGWQDDYGMPPMVMPEELYDRLLQGEQYNNIKSEYDLNTTDKSKLVQLSKDDYIDLGIRMLSGDEITEQINNINMSGIKEADLPQFTAKKKLNINPLAMLFRSIKYGDGGHKPTLLGNFWDYSGNRGAVDAIKGAGIMGLSSIIPGGPLVTGALLLGGGREVGKGIFSSKGDWSFNEEKAREYFDQYYDVQTGMISDEIGKPGSTLSGPTDFNYLYRGGNYLGGEGDAKQWNSYRFQYDHLNNGSKAGQIAIAEMRNMMQIVNGNPETFTTLIGNEGTSPPWAQYEDGMSKRKWDKKLRKGKLGDEEMQLSMQILRQYLNDVQRSDKTKTAPAASILYNQYINADGEDIGSYTLTFDEDYSGKLDNVLGDPKKDAFAKEFKETNSITLYFDRAVDNSPYKASNQTFSPIQADLDTTGEPYTQNWPQVGSYTFYRTGNGGYSARVQPVTFDKKTGNRRLDEPFTLAVDPNVTSFENLAMELESYLYDLARQNNNDQNAFKYSFSQWQVLNEKKNQ